MGKIFHIVILLSFAVLCCRLILLFCPHELVDDGEDDANQTNIWVKQNARRCCGGKRAINIEKWIKRRVEQHCIKDIHSEDGAGASWLCIIVRFVAGIPLFRFCFFVYTQVLIIPARPNVEILLYKEKRWKVTEKRVKNNHFQSHFFIDFFWR